MKPRYLDPLSDFGFKRLFGSELNKDLLIAFLNALLPATHQIQSLEFRNPERMGRRPVDRRAFFDLYCVSTTGQRFIVEIQKVRQTFFKDRCFFYSTFPVQDQAVTGLWDFQLAPVYVVALLDFELSDETTAAAAAGDYLHTVQLKNQRGEVFYDKYMQVYVELPRFRKTERELATEADRWLYFLRHLAELDAPPAGLRGDMFDKAFEEASLTQLTPNQRRLYDEGMRESRDLHNAFVYAKNTGVEEGEVKKAVEVARNGLTIGLSIGQIAQLTGLPEDFIRGL